MTTSFSFVGLRKVWFALSAVLIVGSILALAVFGLKFGVDFTGGSLLEVTFEGLAPATAEITSALANVGFADGAVQQTDNNGAIIRLASLTEEQHQQALEALETAFGNVTEQRFDSIGPTVGSELRRASLTGVAITLLLIGLYISWAFRKVSEPVAAWKYGLLTVLCAAHDVIIPLGAFAVLGHFEHWEVGSAFVAAILTILGYSISDTVVVFDRTRENLLHHINEPFEVTVEKSIRQTFVRSINTSVTTLLALTAIFVFGGDSTRPFALALIIGILVGTYSSIFFASPALVEWEARRNRT
jgi:preprotein translocase subunit SecF